MKVTRFAWLLLTLLAAGCAELGKQAESGPESGSTAIGEQKIESQPLKYLKNRNIKPQPTRPLNVRAKCSTRDAIGTVRRLDLLVKEASVQTFDAQVTMKEYGACRFNLRDFEQVEKSGKGRDGRPVKLAFFRLPAAANGGKNGTIVLYGKSMEALFTNVPAIDLA